MDEPQPNTAPTEGATPVAQPAEGNQQPAAQPQEPVSQGQPAQADDTAAWLQSKGVDPKDPEAFNKVLSMAYNSEKQMTKATQEASELRKSLTPVNEPIGPQDPQGNADPVLNEFIQDYRRDKMLNNFKGSHPDWQQYDTVMGGLLNQQVSTPYGVFARSQLVNEGLLSLEDVYAMAKGSSPANTEQVKAETRQEVLQTLANTQRAGGGAGNAANSNPQAPVDDPVLAGIRASRGQ